MIRAMLLALVLTASANAQTLPTCSEVDNNNGHLVIPSGITSIPDVRHALSGSIMLGVRAAACACACLVPVPRGHTWRRHTPGEHYHAQ